MKRGDVFWRSTPLPGERSGGRHLSVVISSDEYNARTGLPVLAALRRGDERPYRPGVSPDEFIPVAGQPQLDQPRVVEISQCCGVAEVDCGELAGCVTDAVLERVRGAVSRQFQLDGPWTHRGEIWSHSGPGPEAVVLVMNDRAIAQPAQQQVTALPYVAEALEAPVLMIGRANMVERLGQLEDQEQGDLSSTIRRIFGE